MMKRFACILLVLALMIPAAMAEGTNAPSFADFKDLEWIFSSGVGAWYTSMRIAEDGTFTGDFHDSEMGDAGDAYPYGTVYGCFFHGKMTLGAQVDEYTWTVHIDEVELDEGQVPEAIEDGIRYVTSDPYGVKAGRDMLLYLPGTPVENLTEDFLFWAHLYFYETEITELPSYGLYDAEEDVGFIAEEAYPWGDEIVGSWRAAEGDLLLEIGANGDGFLTDAAGEMSVPLARYAEGDGWTVCFGSPDVTGHIVYDAYTDQTIMTDESGDMRVFDRDWTVEDSGD